MVISNNKVHLHHYLVVFSTESSIFHNIHKNSTQDDHHACAQTRQEHDNHSEWAESLFHQSNQFRKIHYSNVTIHPTQFTTTPSDGLKMVQSKERFWIFFCSFRIFYVILSTKRISDLSHSYPRKKVVKRLPRGLCNRMIRRSTSDLGGIRSITWKGKRGWIRKLKKKPKTNKQKQRYTWKMSTEIQRNTRDKNTISYLWNAKLTLKRTVIIDSNDLQGQISDTESSLIVD